jgi:hypothetical protein
MKQREGCGAMLLAYGFVIHKEKIMRLIWCTDIHLDHCPDIPMFIDDVLTMQPDRVVITGDISDSTHIVKHLTILAEQLKVPIDFVLGNHDYYGASQYLPAKMKDVRESVVDVCKEFSNLNWLARSGPVKLTDKACLIGSGLWCDWRAGFGDKSTVWLNDYLLIADLFGSPYKDSDRRRIKNKVQNFARDRTKQLMKDFQQAIDDGFEKIIVGTHVSPWHEASFYNGVVQDDDWAPHFVCQVAGEKLQAEVAKHPNVDVHVYSGHTHGQTPPPGYVEILPNLKATNGPATYRHPAPQMPIIVE